MINVDYIDTVAVVTLSRAPVNAMNRQFMEQVTTTFEMLGDNPDAKCILLKSDMRCFCAGADVKQRGTSVSGELGARAGHNRVARAMFNAIADCPKPVIAAVHGAALGSGLAIVACCDIIVAAESAFFGLPEVTIGLLGGARHAMRILPHSLLREVAFTGATVPAAYLHQIGVIRHYCPDDKLAAESMELARAIVANSGVALCKAKTSLNTIENMSVADGYRFEQKMTNDLMDTDAGKAAFRTTGL